jgi:hypothetical protein
MTRARIALALVAGIMAWSSAPAFGGPANLPDRNDSKGVLDVRKVERFGIERPGFHIVTCCRWSTHRIWDKGFFLVRFDTYGGKRFDYYALVRSDGRQMLASSWRDRRRQHPDRYLGPLVEWRPNRRSVTVRVDLSDMYLGGRNRLTYRWKVETMFTSRHCHRVCFDRAPNKKAVTEPNGKPDL